jgi:hypothetical protein
MNEKTTRTILRNLSEQKAPGIEIDLWPAIRSRLQASGQIEQGGNSMSVKTKFTPRQAIAITLGVILMVVFFSATPPGRAVAQNILQFFTRSESDQLPLQDFQLTPTSGTPSPDPASILNAQPDITEVQQKASFQIYVPAWIPDQFYFEGASIEENRPIVRIFYSLDETTNGLVLRQEPVPMTDECELCGKVGAEATIQEVTIAGVYGEYVKGVWKLTDQGAVWESDPYLKRMRWQDHGMAFELVFMGPPDALSKEEMIAIAESLH